MQDRRPGVFDGVAKHGEPIDGHNVDCGIESGKDPVLTRLLHVGVVLFERLSESVVTLGI